MERKNYINILSMDSCLKKKKEISEQIKRGRNIKGHWPGIIPNSSSLDIYIYIYITIIHSMRRIYIYKMIIPTIILSVNTESVTE